RVLAGGVSLHLDELPEGIDLAAEPDLLVIVDRLTASPSSAARIREAVAAAFDEGEGVSVVVHESGRLRFTEFPACSRCDTPAAPSTPTLFSFNSPRGACPAC